MSLTSAMMVGFTGIKTNGATVDTVGHNIANVNTTAFKGQRTLFETLFYQTVGEGEGPSSTSGGTLPRQIGTGSQVAAIQRDFSQGGMEATGFPSDLAISGDGFFILGAPDGSSVYTRDGAFRLDSTQTLVAINGAPIQVFAADDAGNIQTGTLGSLVIPLGTSSEAVATADVTLDGQLDSATSIASTGAVLHSQALTTATGAPATSSTLLVDLVDANGLPMFADGDEVSIRGVKGGGVLRESTFIVGTTGRTLADFAGHLEAVLGINTDPTTGGSGGVTISDGTDAPAGTLIVASNPGEVNAISLDSSSITNAGGIVPAPLTFAVMQMEAGEGVTTSFSVFDSLGKSVDVRLRLSLESKSESGTVWRFYAESMDDSDVTPLLGTGTISFDPNGQFLGATGTDLTIDRAGTGAVSPLSFVLDYTGLSGLVGSNGESQVIMASQDGAPAGVLTAYEIGPDGVVTGAFSNQRTRVFGQVALATFTNNAGLIAKSENTYVPGVNSGDPVVGAPQTMTAGTVVSGHLEQSNVEIAREFINLITASTGISSAGRVVRVADDLLQELLLIVR